MTTKEVPGWIKPGTSTYCLIRLLNGKTFGYQNLLTIYLLLSSYNFFYDSHQRF